MATHETLADLLTYHGVDSINALSRAVYKGTSCGAYAQEPNERDRAEGYELIVGTIVEGSDASFYEPLKFPLTVKEWDDAIARLEDQAEEAWNEANEDDEDE